MAFKDLLLWKTNSQISLLLLSGDKAEEKTLTESLSKYHVYEIISGGARFAEH